MYQSVMAQRQGTGSSGIGFAFMLGVIKDLNPAQNICLVQNLQTGDTQQVGLDKRGQIVWPQVGDTWLVDRSMGHWALRCKVTGTSAPAITGSVLDPGLHQVITVLAGLGLIEDQTTATALPVGQWQAPASLTTPFANYGGAFQTVRYLLDSSGFVNVEGVVKTSAAISGSAPIFTLPNGFIPQKNHAFSSQANGTSCFELTVDSTGGVLLTNIPASTTISYASIECRFSVL